MSAEPDITEVAAALRLSVGLLVRRLRQVGDGGGLTLSESSALKRLELGGAVSSAELARAEQISPQSMGATLAALGARGLVARRDDPQDGRRSVVSLTDAGLRALSDRHNARTEQLAEVLADQFSTAELAHLMAAAPLIERLAQRI